MDIKTELTKRWQKVKDNTLQDVFNLVARASSELNEVQKQLKELEAEEKKNGKKPDVKAEKSS